MTNASVMKAPEAVDHAALAETMPLDEIDVSNPALYQEDVWQPYFRRLRREAPVHYCPDKPARAVLVGDQAQGHHRARSRP